MTRPDGRWALPCGCIAVYGEAQFGAIRCEAHGIKVKAGRSVDPGMPAERIYAWALAEAVREGGHGT